MRKKLNEIKFMETVEIRGNFHKYTPRFNCLNIF